MIKWDLYQGCNNGSIATLDQCDTPHYQIEE